MIWVDFVVNMNLVCKPVVVEYAVTYPKRMGAIKRAHRTSIVIHNASIV